MIYLSLFLVAFISGSLFPLGSEALLLYDLSEGCNPFGVWSVATLGNTLGALLNYWLGYKGEGYLERKGYLSSEKMQQARQRFKRWGGWVLLLSWAPIIGDPLTFIAGVLRYDLKRFLLIVVIAKGVRYGVLVWMML